MNVLIRYSVLLSFLLAACGSDGGGETVPVPAAETQQAESPEKPKAKPAALLLTAAGRFTAKGVTEPSRLLGGFACSNYELVMDNEQMSVRQMVYARNDCKGELLGEVFLVGSIKELHVNERPSHYYDLTIHSVRLVKRSEMWALIFGSGDAGACEAIPLNEEVDVAGLDCRDIGKFPLVGQVFYGRYRYRNKDQVMMTYLPHEVPGHVGSPEIGPAPRATYLRVRYDRVKEVPQNPPAQPPAEETEEEERN